MQDVGRGCRLDRLLLQSRCLRRVEVAVVDHLIKRIVAPDFRIARVKDRIEQRGGGDEAREGGRLKRREVLRILAPVGLGGGLHAVGALTEVDRVQVAGEDLILRDRFLELDRKQGLANLLGDGARRSDVGHRTVLLLHIRARVLLLHELLGDRGRALDDLVLHEVGPRGAQDADRVDARVAIEPVILHSDDGLLRLLGDVRKGDDRAVDRPVDLREERAIAIVEQSLASHAGSTPIRRVRWLGTKGL